MVRYCQGEPSRCCIRTLPAEVSFGSVNPVSGDRRIGGTSVRMIDGALPSHVVVHAELIWMRSQTEGVVLLLFYVDPVGDEVGVEDVAFKQEGMIGLECFDRAAE